MFEQNLGLNDYFISLNLSATSSSKFLYFWSGSFKREKKVPNVSSNKYYITVTRKIYERFKAHTWTLKIESISTNKINSILFFFSFFFWKIENNYLQRKIFSIPHFRGFFIPILNSRPLIWSISSPDIHFQITRTIYNNL